MFIYDTPPCKDCKKRITHCHATCEDYKIWKADHETRRQKILEKERVSEQIRAQKIDFANRYWRKIHQKRK